MCYFNMWLFFIITIFTLFTLVCFFFNYSFLSDFGNKWLQEVPCVAFCLEEIWLFHKAENYFFIQKWTSDLIKYKTFPGSKETFSIFILLPVHGGRLLSWEKNLAEGRMSLILTFIACEASAKTAFERVIHFLNTRKWNCGTHCGE